MPSDAQSVEDVAPDEPSGTYGEGYADGYEAGKQAATTGMWALGYQAGWGEFREQLARQVDLWANEPVPTLNDGKVSE